MFDKIKLVEDELIEVRRALHRIPEIGDSLPKTKKFVCDYLDKTGVSYRCCDNCDAVIAEIEGVSEGKTIAFRGDMDALNIIEETNVPFRSEHEGRMHGCGHDAHTAILLIVAKILYENRDSFSGKVRLLFQTGEETGSGAKKLIECGGAEGLDAVFALHVGNLAGDELSCGDFAILPGYVSSGKMKFTIEIKGIGTHSAFPEKGIDPIIVAARILIGFDEVIKAVRETGAAAVLSVGSVHAGEDHNTIPETAILKGSLRAQDPDLRDYLAKKVEEISVQAASQVGATCNLDIKRGSDPVCNDEKMAKFASEAVASVSGESHVFTSLPRPLMASDDFANYAKRIPSVYFMLHTNNPQKGINEPNHSPRFDIDESVLIKGVSAYVAIAMSFGDLN